MNSGGKQEQGACESSFDKVDLIIIKLDSI